MFFVNCREGVSPRAITRATTQGRPYGNDNLCRGGPMWPPVISKKRTVFRTVVDACPYKTLLFSVGETFRLP